LLVADSHVRGVAEMLVIKIRSSSCTIDYVKPNADLNNDIINEIRDQELK